MTEMEQSAQREAVEKMGPGPRQETGEKSELVTGRELAPGEIVRRAGEYIEACGGRFPNLAGLCRWLGMGVSAFERAMGEHPEERGLIGAMLEDEALNSGLTATLLSAYLKRRLGYGEREEEPADGVQLVFRHDIFADGE